MPKKAQSVIEYTFLIATIIVAFVAMNVYIKRGIQGKIRSGADEVGAGLAYSPGATISDIKITRTIEEGGKSYTVKVDDNEKSVSESTTNITQITTRGEETLSLGDEPGR